jgi:hypothetical protein
MRVERDRVDAELRVKAEELASIDAEMIQLETNIASFEGGGSALDLQHGKTIAQGEKLHAILDFGRQLILRSYTHTARVWTLCYRSA